MKKILLCVFIFFSPAVLFAAKVEQPETDLGQFFRNWGVSGEASPQDTLRIHQFLKRAAGAQSDSLRITYLNQALQVAEEVNWDKGIMIANAELGRTFGTLRANYTAVIYLLKSLPIAKRLNDVYYLAFCYQYLGDCYTELKDYQTAKKYHYQAISNYRKSKNMKRYLLGINSLGLDFYAEKKFEQAIKIFGICAEKGGTEFNTSYTLVNIGAAYREMGLFEKAVEYFQKFTHLTKDPYGIAFAEKEIAHVFYLKKDYAQALTFAKHSMLLKGERSDTDEEIHQLLYQLYDALKRPAQSLEHYKIYTRLRESNLALMESKQVESLAFYLENERQRDSIESLNRERKIMGFGIFLFAVFISLLLWNVLVLRSKNTKIKAQREEILLIKNEIEETNQTLEKKVDERTSQLTLVNEELIRKNQEIIDALFKGQTIERKRVAAELHDNLGGTLSAIKWRLEALNTHNLNDKEKEIYDSILLMMKTAYSDVRHISHNLIPSELEQKGLIGALQKLITDLNQNGRLQISLTQTDIPVLNKRLEFELYSICMELINNILKHANASQAFITFTGKDKEVLLSVKDNGRGINRVEGNNGMGLRNLQSRLDSIGGNAEIRTSGAGLEVLITIQM